MKKFAFDFEGILQDDKKRAILGALLGGLGVGGMTALSIPEMKSRARRHAAIQAPDDAAKRQMLYEELAPSTFQTYANPIIGTLGGGALGALAAGLLPYLARQAMKNASYSVNTKTAYDVGARLGMVKRALSLADLDPRKLDVSSIGPMLAGALGKAAPGAGLGAAAGGGLGLLHYLLRGEKPEGEEDKRPGMLMSLLMPALIGAGAGGFGSLALGGQGANLPSSEEDSAEVEASPEVAEF